MNPNNLEPGTLNFSRRSHEAEKMHDPSVAESAAGLAGQPPVLAYSTYFYVIPTSAPLRECPSPDCDVLHTVYQGDKVEILERDPSGWSKVRLVDRPAGIGWIPNDQLSYSPDRTTVGLPTYHVNASSVPLYLHPRPESQVLATLHRNDAVEMMGVGTSGWAQVRVLQSNLVGWVVPRYLSPGPPAAP